MRGRGKNYVPATVLLAMLVLPAVAGDVAVQVSITRRLTKKHVAPAAYNLRGSIPQAPPAAAEPVNEFERTVVMLEGGPAAPAAPQSLTVQQRNNRFDPELIVAPVGSTVSFSNLDPIFHNVFSLSKAQAFDLGFYPKDQTRVVKFPRPGIVQAYCHIHSNMYAAIVITASPWYGKPADDGTIRFNDVAPGRYKVVAWHKVAGIHQADVEVTRDGKVDVSIRVPVDVEPRP